MKFVNKIMLITYADSMGKDMKDLDRILSEQFDGAIGGVHILPFFPSTADRGFAPVCYDRVDESLGNWDDVEKLSERYYLMFDFMINHISRHSAYFKDFEKNRDVSPFRDMFIRYKDFWPGGEPTEKDVEKIYKRKPHAPYTVVNFEDGGSEKVWCTFSDDQIDLNVTTDVTKKYIKESVEGLLAHKASIVRLDAFAYAVKKAGTSCFFIEPEIWDLLYEVQQVLDPAAQLILPEIHEHYTIQKKLAEKGFFVYDFALPMLVLYALYSCDAAPLKNWLRICPRNQFTTLDTHDGIGVVDVKDLLSDAQVERTRDWIFERGANVKREYNTRAYNNLDIYQINSTYYSALGNHDDAYLMARAIQFFAPGVPQVYYVGMLAGENDIELLEKTKQGRDINRHNYSKEEITRSLERPVVQNLRALMRFRNSCPAFDGDCVVEESSDSRLCIRRAVRDCYAVLRADLESHTFEIEYTGEKGTVKKLRFTN